jgi:hypothetical protein
VLAAWATRVVTISGSRVRNSLIFGASCFLSPSFFIRAPAGVLARISRRASRPLRTRWACHRSSCWSSGAPGNK